MLADFAGEDATEHQSVIDAIDQRHGKIYGPKVFHILDENSYPVWVDNAFEDTCAALAKETTKPVKSLTVREFYRLLDLVNSRNKKG